jgi:hypothetical protein
MLTICVDCDEVLAQFVEGVNNWHSRVHGTALPLAAYASTHFAKVPGWGSDAEADAKVQAFFAGSPEWLGLAPLPGAREALAALKRDFPALDLQVVTARSVKQREVTLAWLAAHFGGLFSAVHFLSAYDNAEKRDAPAKSKGQVCRELGACALIDDSPSYCITAAPHVPLVLLFSRVPWNTGQAAWEHPALPRNVVRAPGWALAGAALRRLCARAAAAGAGGAAAAPQPPLAFVPPGYSPGCALEASALALPAAAFAALVAQSLPALRSSSGSGSGSGSSTGAGAGAGGDASLSAAAAAAAAALPPQPAGDELLCALEVLEGAVRVHAPLGAALEAQAQALVAAGRASLDGPSEEGLLHIQLLSASS